MHASLKNKSCCYTHAVATVRLAHAAIVSTRHTETEQYIPNPTITTATHVSAYRTPYAFYICSRAHACAQIPGLSLTCHFGLLACLACSGEALTSHPCHACDRVSPLAHAFGPCHLEKHFRIGGKLHTVRSCRESSVGAEGDSIAAGDVPSSVLSSTPSNRAVILLITTITIA